MCLDGCLIQTMKSKVLKRTGLILVLISLLLVCQNVYQEYRAYEGVNDLEQLTFNTDLYEINSNMELPVKTINGKDYVGVLEIQALDIKVGIQKECNDANLLTSPCRYTGTPYKGNMILAGHNRRAHFLKLDQIEIEDEVIFTDMDGNVFTYVVKKIEILSPYDVDSMVNSEYDLSLFTCTYTNTARTTIRLERRENS